MLPTEKRGELDRIGSRLSCHPEDDREGPPGLLPRPAEAGAPQTLWATSTALSQVFTIEERGRDPYAAAERLDLEGIMAKRKANPYGPNTVWYKIKNRAYTQEEGRWELFPKRP